VSGANAYRGGERRGEVTLRGSMHGFAEAASNGAEGAWDEPRPLPSDRQGRPFSSEVLGDPGGAFVDAVAAETGTPVDLAAVGLLGSCSTLIAGSVVVEPHDRWREPTNLYLAAIAAPGEGKTPALAPSTAHLDAIEEDRRERLMPTITDAMATKRIAEDRQRQAEARAAKADGADRQRAEHEALVAAREAAEIAVPAPPRLYTRESTPEGLVRLLAEQGGRFGVVSDEGGEFFELASRYAAGGRANLGIYLVGWDGQRFVSDRAGRDPIAIARTTLSVCLLAQPVVLRDLRKDRQAAGRGLLARFLFSVPPSLVGYRPTQRPPIPPALVDAMRTRLVTLAREAEETGEPAVLRLEDAAAQRFLAWREAHEPRLRAGSGDLAGIVEWASKLPGQVGRLAGNLHALRTGTIHGVITDDTMDAALTLAAYFVDHARLAFATLGVDEATADADRVLDWLREREVDQVSTRDIYSSMDWNHDRVHAALVVLARHGWVREIKRVRRSGRPSERWELHPELRRKTEQNCPERPVVRRSAPSIDDSGPPSDDCPPPDDDVFYCDEIEEGVLS